MARLVVTVGLFLALASCLNAEAANEQEQKLGRSLDNILNTVQFGAEKVINFAKSNGKLYSMFFLNLVFFSIFRNNNINLNIKAYTRSDSVTITFDNIYFNNYHNTCVFIMAVIIVIIIILNLILINSFINFIFIIYLCNIYNNKKCARRTQANL